MIKPRSKKLPKYYRKEAVEYLSEQVKKSNSVLFMAIPGVGKSSFLRFLSSNNYIQTKYFPKTTFLHTDINNLTSITPIEFYRLTLKTLYEKSLAIKDKKIKKAIKELYDENINSTDRLTIFEALKNAFITYTGSTKKQKLVLIIDRYHKLCEGRSETFFNNLRSLRDSVKESFSYIFVSTRELLDIVEMDKISEVYKLFSLYIYHLKPMGEKDAKAVYAEHLPKKFPKNSLRKIEKLADGYPPFIVSLIQLAGEHPNNWESYIYENPSIKFRLAEIWGSFSKEQKDTLKNLANGLNRIDLSNIAISDLLNKGAIKKDGSFFSEIFKNFVSNLTKEELTKYKIAESQIVMDDSRNTILKKGKELKKPLTNQEFRLLSHFIRNPGRICGRDEIAKEVWGEEAIEGVSDEAIDQVVSRLRGKIEDNRNKPKYIVTIRGRGFQFKS